MAATSGGLVDQAREQDSSAEEYLAAVLARRVADREANGCAIRTGGAHFPAGKTLEDHNGDHQRGCAGKCWST